MTLEEAQAEIISLKEKLTETETANESLSKKVEELTADNERVRELNQKYFDKLTQQYSQPDKPEDDEPEAPSCEDFAKTLNI